MSTLVFTPISGGYFVSQTAILAVIMNAINTKGLAKPDAYFGCSGGVIANIIAMKYTNSKETMEKILYAIERDMFLRPWVNLNIVAEKLFSFFKSSLYKKGIGNKAFLENLYTSREFKDTESWILKYDMTANYSTLVCSKGDGTSVFNTQLKSSTQIEYREEIAGCYEIIYADGNLSLLADCINASMSIPGYKPPVEVLGDYYLDGGIAAASPGSLFTNIFLEYANTAPHDTEFAHYFYVIGPQYVDKDIEKDGHKKHWLSQTFKSIGSLLQFSIYRERQNLLNTWVQICGPKHFDNSFTRETLKGETELANFLALRNDKHYFVTCYTADEKVNIVNFGKKDLKRVFDTCFSNTHFDIFWHD